MKCSDNCGYYWQEEDERYPTCHFPNKWPADWAPCAADWEPCAQDEFENDNLNGGDY